MTQTDQIQKMIDTEIVLAEKYVSKFLDGTANAATIADFVENSSLGAIWQVVFQDVDNMDLQVDIDNALRGD